MKKYFLIALVLFTGLVSHAIALSVPKPIKGSAGIVTPSFSTDVGDYIMTIDLPSGWGLGEIIRSDDGAGYYHLFPVKNGIGFKIEITAFDNPSKAITAIEDIRKKCSSVKDLQGGFEAKFSKAYYACRTHEKFLIEMWYAFPKKNKQLDRNWKNLRDCVSFSIAAPKSADKPALEPSPNPFAKESAWKYLPAVEIPIYGGWACNHPSGKLRILFERTAFISCTPNPDGPNAYLLKFDDIKSSGYFYVMWEQPSVKWDKPALDNREPYHQHLQEMLQDILAMEPSQEFMQDPEYNEAKGYAILRGSPYGLITVAEDGFLFGFAVKDKFSTMQQDVGDLLNKVKWQKD